MHEKQPSRTALGAAAYRAAHQSLDGGAIVRDPFAHRILGPDADAIGAELANDASSRRMRVFVAARSRFAEDCLAAAVTRGVRQAVILGAGLDTLSLRSPHEEAGLRLFEVDHPATQAWKRRWLAEAGLATPALLSFAPIDLEERGLEESLLAAGFRTDAPAFFLWLGVTPYLRRDAIRDSLRFISNVPDAEVALDYVEPLASYPPERRARVAALGARAAALGEPWLSFFEPDEMARELRALGLAEQADLDLAEIAVRYLDLPREEARPSGGPHVIHARRR